MADKKISQLTGATTPLAGTEVLPIVQGGSTVKVAVSDLTAGRAMTATKIGLGMTATYALDVTDNSTGVQGRISSSSSNGTSFAMTNSATNGRTWRIGNNYVIGNGEWSLYDDTASKEVLRADSSQNVRAVQGNFIVGTAGKGIDFSANSHAAGMTSELLNWYEEGTWTPTVRGSGTAGTYEIGTNGCTYTRIGRQVTLNVYIQMAGTVTGGGTGDLQITGVPYAKAANANPVAAVYLALGTFTGNPPTASWNSFSSSSTIILNQIASGGYGTAIPISYASANAYITFSMTYFV